MAVQLHILTPAPTSVVATPIPAPHPTHTLVVVPPLPLPQNMGTASFSGPGAGRYPTANSVVNDIVRLGTGKVGSPFPFDKVGEAFMLVVVSQMAVDAA